MIAERTHGRSWAGVAAAVLVMLSGCDSEQARDAAIAAAKAVPPPSAVGPAAGSIKPASDKATGSWTYSPVGKRDPFRSYLADLEERAIDDKEHKVEETEKFELDQYRLTGLVTGTAQPKAMVEDPTGTGHVLHIGSRLGKNSGRITRIGEDAIVVTEEFRAPTGERVRVPITIKLPKPESDLGEQP
jgi:type IV pilus assembly protein PilP